MIIALKSPPRALNAVWYFCDKPDCVNAAADAAKRWPPVTTAWTLPKDATCFHCKREIGREARRD